MVPLIFIPITMFNCLIWHNFSFFFYNFFFIFIVLIELWHIKNKNKTIFLLSDFLNELKNRPKLETFIILLVTLFFLKTKIILHLLTLYITLILLNFIFQIINIDICLYKNLNVIINIENKNYNQYNLNNWQLCYLLFHLIPKTIAFLFLYVILTKNSIIKHEILVRLFYFKILNFPGIILKISLNTGNILYKIMVESNLKNKKILVRPFIYVYVLNKSLAKEINNLFYPLFLNVYGKKITIKNKNIFLNGKEICILKEYLKNIFITKFNHNSPSHVIILNRIPHKLMSDNKNFNQKGSSFEEHFTSNKKIKINDQTILAQIEIFLKKNQYKISAISDNKLILPGTVNNFDIKHELTPFKWMSLNWKSNFNRMCTLQDDSLEWIYNSTTGSHLKSLYQLKQMDKLSIESEKLLIETYNEEYFNLIEYIYQTDPYINKNIAKLIIKNANHLFQNMTEDDITQLCAEVLVELEISQLSIEDTKNSINIFIK